MIKFPKSQINITIKYENVPAEYCIGHITYLRKTVFTVVGRNREEVQEALDAFVANRCE